MSTIFDNENPEQTMDDEGFGGGLLIGLLVFIVFLAAVLYFGIPVFNRMQVNVPAPQIKIDSPQVVVPKRIEIVPAN